METARILLGGIAGMMQDILRDAIASQPDMHLVGEVAGDLQGSVVLFEPDAVIADERAIAGEQDVVDLLAARPRMTLTVISGSGGEAILFELRRTTLVDPSPMTLLEGIRAALQRGAHES